MIRTLTLQGIKSFPKNKPVTINFDNKRVALFFGLNGAGKSAIAEIIDRNGNVKDPLNGCSIETTGVGPYKYVVYNEEFIERNFRGKSDFPGIFTIGEKDVDALKEEEQKQGELNDKDAEKVAVDEKISSNREMHDKALQAAYAATWSIYTAHGKGHLKSCTEGYGNSKQKLFEKLIATPLVDAEVVASIDEIASKMLDIDQSDGVQKLRVSIDLSGFSEIEAAIRWDVPVVGSKDSSLSELVEKLGNVDWVGQGRTYIHDERCPFCQQKLPHDFLGELSSLVDGIYKKSVEEIERCHERYSVREERLSAQVAAVVEREVVARESAGFQRCWAELHAAIMKNLDSMRRKIDRPAESIEIMATSELCQKFMSEVRSVNERIDRYNDLIANKGKEKARTIESFWKRMRVDYDPAIRQYQNEKSNLGNEAAKLTAELSEIQSVRDALILRLKELRSKNIGADKAVQAINDELQRIGIKEFRIEKKSDDGKFYYLKREGVGDGEYKSLSEGEKTVISFLYFIAHLNGVIDVDNPVANDKKIVVVDDPISSLSHNYVYDIASVLAEDIIEVDGVGAKFKQVLVMTHSLFFFHELVKQLKLKGDIKAFRVVKGDGSDVVPMRLDEIKNEYGAYWQILKDARHGRANSVSVPNAMRCIFEYFFAFTQQEGKFKAALRKIETDDVRFTPLARYLDRKSHADPVNLFDHGGYDVAYYLDKFRVVFERTEYQDHYRLMMTDEVA